MDLSMEPQATARADVVAVLEELHDVLLKIDAGETDRRYVDFEALAERLAECIDKVAELGGKGRDEERPESRAEMLTSAVR